MTKPEGYGRGGFFCLLIFFWTKTKYERFDRTPRRQQYTEGPPGHSKVMVVFFFFPCEGSAPAKMSTVPEGKVEICCAVRRRSSTHLRLAWIFHEY